MQSSCHAEDDEQMFTRLPAETYMAHYDVLNAMNCALAGEGSAVFMDLPPLFGSKELPVLPFRRAQQPHVGSQLQ